ncbi:CAZyme family GH18 [Penicillium hetheringtonii]|uniref:chitinase n=1 Tax=Penicillium hetheringtonii TaxID=911720 RepID=A0AAD6DS29_9EURO|nr:CAZyme family GH18 [Penicillium hetheringtonii]
MKRIYSIGGSYLGLLLATLALILVGVNAEGCSTLNQCATGCCNKGGYCGIGDDYCGADCVANCDYQPECDASKPCTKGCCNQYGYCGLGPDFCADDVCVGNCDRKSECDPDNYGDFAESDKCPLNVCCSKFGFCGTTKEFCGKKKVRRPSCSKNGSLNRVVGYYEGWSHNRPCHTFFPEQIPAGVYTHLNYAFATIDPENFRILPSTASEKDLMKRLTNLKKIDPDLKVFIAVGGWTFNDPGVTQNVFSDLAASESNQKKFFRSLSSFMSTYNFDGIDLDWEYPAADDRGGRKEDFDNFPKFMANLKKFLKSTGGRDGLSITLPASYWYLQHFDIVNLEKHVDFFNIMSYDIHGKWDLGNEWVDPVLDSHTNLTEITNALDLLWRNDIKSEKVVLGLAFYGRVFAAADPKCMDPGCAFVSGVGILLNSELMDIMDEQNLHSKLDKDAAVKILEFDSNQWTTYDNGDTFKLKTEFAKSQCLGGVMVWAVSHDLPYGNFSRTLGDAVGRTVKSLQPNLNGDMESMQVKKVHEQCKWTNCFEDCPSGWSRVRRTDDGAREDEHMWDETGCGAGQHTFCCPPSADLPKCGWYTHNNGKCDSECPTGYVEVGSNIKYCSNNNDDYQAACCTTDTKSMKLYSQCEWEGEPRKCNEKCASDKTEVALSTTGSGGVFCDPTDFDYTWNGQETTSWEERSYCCSQRDDVSWSKCDWYDDVGLADAADVVDGYCYSGCPDERVRVALDQHGGGCKGAGGRAMCCLPGYTTKETRPYTNSESRLESNIQDFLANGNCGLDDYSSKRDFIDLGYFVENATLSASDHPSILQRRFESTKGREAMEDLLTGLVISFVADAAKRKIWDDNVVASYPHLTPTKIRAYMDSTRDWVLKGSTFLVNQIVCHLDYYNNLLGGQEVVSCECITDNCCGADDLACSVNDVTDDSTDLTTRNLEKRAGKRTFTVQLSDGSFIIYSLPYPDRIRVPRSDALLSRAFEFADRDCTIPDVIRTSVTPGRGTITSFQIEHILELNTISMFIRDANAGRLRSGATARNAAISATFIRQALDGPILISPPPMVGGAQTRRPIVRVMNALGSSRNRGDFVLLLEALNGLKSRIWRGDTYYAEIEDLVENDNPEPALKAIRSVITVITYLNDDEVKSRLARSSNEVRTEFGLLDTAWEDGGNQAVNIQDYWDEWIRDLLKLRSNEASVWVTKWTKKMHDYWKSKKSTAKSRMTLTQIGSLRSLGSDMDIDRSDLE